LGTPAPTNPPPSSRALEVALVVDEALTMTSPPADSRSAAICASTYGLSFVVALAMWIAARPAPPEAVEIAEVTPSPFGGEMTPSGTLPGPINVTVPDGPLVRLTRSC